MRFFVNVITLLDIDIVLASRAFPKHKKFVVYAQCPMGSNSIFPNGRFIFPNSFSLVNT